MADELRRQRDERSGSRFAQRPRAGGLLERIWRTVAPRPTRVLVMDRDGRLACADFAPPGEQASR